MYPAIHELLIITQSWKNYAPQVTFLKAVIPVNFFHFFKITLSEVPTNNTYKGKGETREKDNILEGPSLPWEPSYARPSCDFST